METSKPGLMTIPPEIREEIYRHILRPEANRSEDEDEYVTYNYGPALVLFLLNRQIYQESRKVFRDLNVFVQLVVPWAETQHHVAVNGHVPIVVPMERADKFTYHQLTVITDASGNPMLDLDTYRFIILLDDLPVYTRLWYYMNLTYPLLNDHLHVTLRMRDPFTPSWEEKHIPKAVQRRMLLPFAEVKQLQDQVIEGDPKPLPSVVAELLELQAQESASVEQCLRECTRLKGEGNAELAAGRYRAALRCYTRAWEAIHILVKGRERHIYADRFFARNLTEPPFEGKNGQSERLILRVQLVANTCQVYLKLADYERCYFWGLRTIRMLRNATGTDGYPGSNPEEEAIRGFPGADQMGKIYYRTAVACKELGNESEARQLLKVAEVYLPHDKIIKKEIEATALRIG